MPACPAFTILKAGCTLCNPSKNMENIIKQQNIVEEKIKNYRFQ
jgi:hypothetical protein